MVRPSITLRPRWLILTSLIGIAVAAVGVTQALTTQVASPTEVIGQALWSAQYTTVKELVNDSTTVVLGTFAAAGPPILLDPTHSDASAPFITPHTFIVSKTISGAAVQGPITVYQTGGVRGTVTYRIIDEPLFQQGQTYVLFLQSTKTNTTAEPIPTPGYFAIGGPQGEFIVEGTNVYSADHQTSQAQWMPMKVDGQPLPQFLQAIQEASS